MLNDQVNQFNRKIASLKGDELLALSAEIHSVREFFARHSLSGRSIEAISFPKSMLCMAHRRHSCTLKNTRYQKPQGNCIQDGGIALSES